MIADSKTCETCGEVFFRRPRYGVEQFAVQRFCSRSCVRRTLKPQIVSPYRGTKRNGRRIDQHRAIMEEIVGRRLGRFEFVHHINGDKQDNRPENLALVSPKQHAAEHGQQKYPLTKECQVCGVVFTPHPTKRKRAKVCSPECRLRIMSLIHRKPNAPNSMYREDAYPCQKKSRK